MGLFDKIRRALAGQNAEPTPPPVRPTISVTRSPQPAPQPGGRPAAKRAARTLLARFSDDIPDDELLAVSAREGVDPDDVRAAVDERREQLDGMKMRPNRVDPAKLRVMDLTSVASLGARIVGSSYAVTDTERRRHGGSAYLLIREPDNPVDPLAVAVYSIAGQRVGYVSAARAAAMSPLLAQLDADAFRITGTGATENSIVLRADLPRTPALRTFVQGQCAPRTPPGCDLAL